MVHMVASGNIPNDKGILIVNTDAHDRSLRILGSQGLERQRRGHPLSGRRADPDQQLFPRQSERPAGRPVGDRHDHHRNSEFANNGAGDGYTHNLYVNSIAKLTITDSYFHDAVVGHEIKSRAAETVITNTRIIDHDSTSSYSVDMPNGGKATLSGNIIQQGPNGQSGTSSPMARRVCPHRSTR
jgi:hypothetical protein